ncbi:histone chaperone, partial [Linderina pennispora]
MSDNKAVDIKNDGEKHVDTAPTPQNTPIFNAPIAAAAAAAAAAAGGDDVTPVQNAALLSMLQGRLGNLIGASSGYVESLPKEVRARVDSLRYLQKQHTEIDAKLHLEILELEKKYQKLYAPLYARRTEIISGSTEPTDEEKAQGAAIAAEEKGDEEPESGIQEVNEDDDEETPRGIPDFWLTALGQHPQLSELITERDEEAVKFLRDVRMA